MTLSSDWKTPPVILFSGLRPGARGLDRGDVDLLHRHHCFHCALRGGAIRVVRRVEQHARRDLPGEAPAILAPAAPTLLAAIAYDRVPVTIGVFLVFGQDHEADRLVRLEMWPAIEAEERLTKDGELDGELLARLRRRIVRGGRVDLPDLAVGEHARVELGRLAGLAAVEPQARGHLAHVRSPHLPPT